MPAGQQPEDKRGDHEDVLPLDFRCRAMAFLLRELKGGEEPEAALVDAMARAARKLWVAAAWKGNMPEDRCCWLCAGCRRWLMGSACLLPGAQLVAPAALPCWLADCSMHCTCHARRYHKPQRTYVRVFTPEMKEFALGMGFSVREDDDYTERPEYHVLADGSSITLPNLVVLAAEVRPCWYCCCWWCFTRHIAC